MDAGEGGSGLELVAQVFAHSQDTLYRLDPKTKAVTEVGKLEGCFAEPGKISVLDLAVNEQGTIYATTGSGTGSLYRVDEKTAACTLIATTDRRVTSLSFLPKGTLDPNAEALVAFDKADYLRLDPLQGGALTEITAGALEGGLESSGDIVSVKGGGTFLTVRGGGCETDCIIEIDPKTGRLVKDYGPTTFAKVYGLAYWGGIAYGFADGGELFQIVFGGSNVATTPIEFTKPDGLRFWGAGSTTIAPITEIY